jgi:hypothetical protein
MPISAATAMNARNLLINISPRGFSVGNLSRGRRNGMAL